MDVVEPPSIVNHHPAIIEQVAFSNTAPPKYDPVGALPMAVYESNDDPYKQQDDKKDGALDMDDIPDDELAVAVEVDDDEDVEVAAAVQIDPLEKQKKLKKYRRIAAGVGLIVVVVVVVVAVFATQESVDAPAVVEPTGAPTPAPTSSRRADIESLLVQNGIVLSGVDNVENSPQYKAFEWISDVDELALSSTDSNLLQRYALATFYYATNEGMGQCQEKYISFGGLCEDAGKVPFLSGVNECDWYGTQCNEDNVVTTFRVAANSLSGTIPEEIRFLNSITFLQIADLGTAGAELITGPIPESLGELSNLEDLVLSGNALTGTLPDSLYDLASLKFIQLNNNKIDGSISSNIGKLSSLASFYFLDNSFEGSLPSEIGKLKKLSESSRRGTILDISCT